MLQYKIGIVQAEIYPTKEKTIKNAQPLILKAVEQGAKLVVLGETFTSYYFKKYLQENAEDFNDANNRPAYDFILEQSKIYKIVIVAGLPEKIGDVFYNTSICVQDGQLLGKYHKTHLFDGKIGNISWSDSETFKQGNKITVVDTVCGKIGLGICYDLRFPSLAQALKTKGAQLIIYPGGFSPIRGPLHWELLLRARAVDNNLYTIGVSTATYQGDDPNIYKFWGHSMLVNPWGQVLVEAEEQSGVFIEEIDLTENEKLSNQIPTLSQKRKDLYEFILALIQNIIHSHKKETLASVAQNIKDAVDQGAQVVILGECFNSYYQTIHLQNNSEDFSDPNNRETYDFLSELSRKYNLLLFGGSIPEKGKDNKLFNTALCFNNGELIGKYSKTHLFDIDIPGKITYFESKTFSQGNEICVVDTQYGKFGIGICYDVRFPEMAQIMRDRGCHFLVYPGAFNQTTGPLHWELLLRARALDNQLFLAGVSAARYRGDDQGIYQAWGHSSLIDPWGRVLVQAQQDPAVLIHDIDLDEVQKIRQQIPVSLQKRVDLYELKSK